MADAADATFDGAADRVASAALAGTLPAGAALTLYALFKQATAGDCATKRPPLWDVKGRAKWAGWAKLKGVACADARQAYIAEADSAVPAATTTVTPFPPPSLRFGPVFSVPTPSADGGFACLPPLTAAAAAGDAAAVSALLAAGAKPDASDADGATALHWAADAGTVAAVRALLAGGAAVDAVDGDGATPLMYAALRGHADAATALLDAGADPDAVDGDREGVRDKAAPGWWDEGRGRPV